MLNIINLLSKISVIERIWVTLAYIIVIALAISLVISYALFFKLEKLYDNRYHEGSKL